jgi:hypothetical protein
MTKRNIVAFFGFGVATVAMVAASACSDDGDSPGGGTGPGDAAVKDARGTSDAPDVNVTDARPATSDASDALDALDALDAPSDASDAGIDANSSTGSLDGGDSGDGRDSGSDGGGSDSGDASDGSTIGPRIAFVSNRDGQDHIYLARSDGTDVEQLTRGAFKDFGPAWTPDGARLFFASTRSGTTQIFVYDRTTKATSPVATGLAYAVAPTVSRDGQWIAFQGAANEADDSTIFKMPVAGGAVTPLTTGAGSDSQPAWSGDGSEVFFVTLRTKTNAEIRAVRADASSNRIVASTERALGRPAVSPSGRYIAFAQPQPPSGTVSIVMLDLTAKGRWVVSETADSEPAFGATDATLYATTLVGQNPDIVVMDSAMGANRRTVVADSAVDGATAFAPVAF